MGKVESADQRHSNPLIRHHIFSLQISKSHLSDGNTVDEVIMPIKTPLQNINYIIYITQ